MINFETRCTMSRSVRKGCTFDCVSAETCDQTSMLIALTARLDWVVAVVEVVVVQA